ncbi:MAG TPA: hypothetical protein ENJ23_04085, partial [Bacteroidetes bacterium]|nr:hypothetical protein [Bacteroidota bacterium]
MQRKLAGIFLAGLVLSLAGTARAQNYVTAFSATEHGGKLAIVVQAQQPFHTEIIPFESRPYSMVNLKPLQFRPETRDSLLAPLKSLSVRVHALEMMDGSVLLTFKGIPAKRIAVRQGRGGREVRLSVAARGPVPKAEPVVPASTTAQKYLDEANLLFENGALQRALEKIHRALRIRRDLPQAYLLAGKIREKLGQDDLARTNFRIALRLNPDLNEARALLRASTGTAAEKPSRRQKERNVQAAASDRPNAKAGANLQAAMPVARANKDSLKASAQIAASAPQQAKGGAPQTAQASDAVHHAPAHGKSAVRQGGAREHSPLQFALFSMIIGFPVFWLVLIFKYRRRILAKPSPEQIANRAEFEQMLEKMQKQTFGQDSPAKPVATVGEERVFPLGREEAPAP